MSKKPEYRHSFSNPERTEKEKFSVNRFGHTILGSEMEENVLPHEEMEVAVDTSGNIVASRKAEIFEHPAVKQWALNAGIDLIDEEQAEAIEISDDSTAAPAEAPQSLFDRLPTSLDEMIRESQLFSADAPMEVIPATATPRLNRSTPQEVQITLPADLGLSRSAPKESYQAPASAPQRCSGCQGSHPEGARFCPHCGMALARFCVQCGYQFSSSEKFCPDCGTRR